MSKTWIILGVLLIALLAWLVLDQGVDDRAPTPAAEPTSGLTAENGPGSPSHSSGKPPHHSPGNDGTTAVAQTDHAPNEPALPDGQLFHQDPLIDAIMGMQQFDLCRSYLSDAATSQELFAALTDQQKHHLQPHLDGCEQHQEAIQFYSQDRIFTALNQWEQNPEKFKLYQAMLFSKDPYSVGQKTAIQQHLKQLTGIEMLFTAALYEQYFQDDVYPLVMQELQAHDLEMVRYVTQQAMGLIACANNTDCSAASALMQIQCSKTESACGLSFAAFVNGHYTEGLRNEIITAKKVLENRLFSR